MDFLFLLSFSLSSTQSLPDWAQGHRPTSPGCWREGRSLPTIPCPALTQELPGPEPGMGGPKARGGRNKGLSGWDQRPQWVEPALFILTAPPSGLFLYLDATHPFVSELVEGDGRRESGYPNTSLEEAVRENEPFERMALGFKKCRQPTYFCFCFKKS